MPRIHLQQVHSRQTLPGKAQASGKDLAAGQVQKRHRLVQTLEDKTGAASYLKKILRLREIMPHRPLQ